MIFFCQYTSFVGFRKKRLRFIKKRAGHSVINVNQNYLELIVIEPFKELLSYIN